MTNSDREARRSAAPPSPRTTARKVRDSPSGRLSRAMSGERFDRGRLSGFQVRELVSTLVADEIVLIRGAYVEPGANASPLAARSGQPSDVLHSKAARNRLLDTVVSRQARVEMKDLRGPA